MAQNPCLKLYEIVKKLQAFRRATRAHNAAARRLRSGLEQIGTDFHFFETVTGTTKLTI